MKKSIVIISCAILISLSLLTCQMTVNDPIRPFLDPYISVQPASHALFVGDTAIPTLEFEVWDWGKKDGALSYQWYTFDSIDDFCANDGAGTAIAGASGELFFEDGTASASYTPSSLKNAVGDRNYFYVVVTNNNTDVLGAKTEGTIMSQVAIISFNDEGAPWFPVITQHPVSNAYRFGESLRNLEVKAHLPSYENKEQVGSFLTYQWYQNDKFSVSGGKAIQGATKTAFMPTLKTLKLGPNYFYVVVTNNYQTGVAETTMPAVITMNPGVRAAAPDINQQPKDMLIFTGGAMGALTVKAESPDSGWDEEDGGEDESLSYQWYSNNRASVESGAPEKIDGATKSSFTPSTATATASVNYYYVAVTNTNLNVTGETTATVNSKPVKVTVAAPGTQLAKVTVTISDFTKPENRFNYVRGYGGMDTAWANFPETTAADTEFMYNPDTGLGYNILRIMISPKSSNIEATMNWLVLGYEDLDTGGGFRQDYYENVKIVNRHGGYVLASPWSPPKEWKSNNSINGGGHLIYSYRKQYAQYLKAFAQHMYNHGAPIYAISIQNEPNYVAGYDGCEWTGEEMRDFYKLVGHFTDGVKGYGGGIAREVVLTMNGESANTPYEPNRAALNDPLSNAAIDLLARHVYGSQNDRLWDDSGLNTPLKDMPEEERFEVWMTEHNINSASPTAYPNDYTWNYMWRFMNDVDLVMRQNNENAFVWWAAKRFYSMLSDGQNYAPGGSNGNGGVRTNPSPGLPRGYGLSHYAKYTIDKTRVRVDVEGEAVSWSSGKDADPSIRPVNVNSNNNPFSMDDLSAKITAYVSKDGNEISMVMWTPTGVNGSGGLNPGLMEIVFPDGFTASGVSAVISKSSDVEERTYMQPHPVELSSDRKSAFVTLGRSEIISIRFSR